MNPNVSPSRTQASFRTGRLLALLAILSLLVAPASALAQAPTPGQVQPEPTDQPLTPYEMQRLSEARSNQGAPVDPFLEGGYVDEPGVVAPSADIWINGFCLGNQSCLIGDFDGDGDDDIAALWRNTVSGSGEGDVYVALSNGAGFDGPGIWHPYFCLANDVCKTGDVNGDGLDDLVNFSRVEAGKVKVALSRGSYFDTESTWNSYFCVGNEVCDVGDFDGDGDDDIVLFMRNTWGNTKVGYVQVAVSNRNGAFLNAGTWSTFFCIMAEQCAVADVDGDYKDDILTFTKGSGADVYVAKSTGFEFVKSPGNAKWSNYFCAGSEVCDTGDMNGDNLDDVLAFLRSSYRYTNPPNLPSVGDVFVGISRASAAAGGFVSQKWHENFCVEQEICGTGDFNGDQRDDLITFARGTAGAVWVELSPGPPPYRWVKSLLVRPR